eukprot:scaffold1789_cov375-Prasinococcus_capsulatus_cf.AAC.11
MLYWWGRVTERGVPKEANGSDEQKARAAPRAATVQQPSSPTLAIIPAAVSAVTPAARQRSAPAHPEALERKLARQK